MPNYAELKLYFGMVNSRGLREGRYEREPTSQGSQAAIAYARDQIEEFLQYCNKFGREHAIIIGFSDNGVARSEPEAMQLISHAEANLPNATGLVIPFDVIHGSLRFHRVIRFDGAKRESLDEIVAEMKQSGHLPYTKERARHDFIIDDAEFQRINDQKWRAALSFY